MKSNEIRRLRKDTGLNRDYFSFLFSVCGATITNWELGSRNPAKLYVILLCKLRERINEYKGKENSTKIKELLASFVLKNEVEKFIAWLFNETDNTGN